MPIITISDQDADFWEENSHLNMIQEYKNFKSREGYDKSGKILKAIYYIWDPRSELRDSGLSENKLINDVSLEILGDANFDWDPYDEIRDFYLKSTISKMQSMLLRYEKEINDLNTMLENWKWDKKDVTTRAKAVSQYKILFDEYMSVAEKVKDELEEEDLMYGDYVPSLIEELGQ